MKSHWSQLLRLLFFWLVFALGATPALSGCFSAEPADEADSTEGAIGSTLVDRFPPRESIDFAMDRYLKDPVGARAREPMGLDEFFGSRSTESMNKDKLRVELLKPNPRFSEKPIAFLRAYFHGTDMYWNNRYKDVQLYRLIESTGTRHNPFPEATYARSEGAALVRMWSDYKPVSKGAPAELTGDALQAELARIAIWSYVSGNVDGPAHNGNNGGFARFRDASGREFWRGVLIDAGAAWNMPDPSHQPWNTNLLGKGPVKRAHIPEDVVNSLIQIARASLEDLAVRSKFDDVDDGAKAIVRDIRARAQQVLEHYGISWRSSELRVIPFPRRPAARPLRAAA